MGGSTRPEGECCRVIDVPLVSFNESVSEAPESRRSPVEEDDDEKEKREIWAPAEETGEGSMVYDQIR